MLLLAACRPPEDVLTAELALADPRAELARLLTVEADAPSALTVAWETPGGPVSLASPELATRHEWVLAGFPPDTVTALDVTLTDGRGRVTEVTGLSVATDPLPDHFVDVRVLASDPDRVQPGYTLLNARPAGGSPWDDEDWLVALDASGAVVWTFVTTDGLVYDARLTADHTIIAAAGGRVFEWDLAGRTVASWEPEGWGTDAVDVAGVDLHLHHEVYPLDDGGLLTITKDHVEVDAYPTSYTDPSLRAPALVADDRVLVFERDGAVRWSWSLADALDVERIGYYSLRPASEDSPAFDWGHANAVVPGPDGDVIVSLRHQDAVVSLEAETGALRWLLANDANWSPALEAMRLQPVGDVTWPYHQHAPELHEDGTLVMFDNGNERASPWTTEVPLTKAQCWSRPVVYRIDPIARTVAQEWDLPLHPTDGRLYSEAVGDANLLENGNVLATYGWIVYQGGQPTSALGQTAHEIRIIEADPTTDDLVLDLSLTARDDPRQPEGWVANRAIRAAALSPYAAQ